MRKVVSKDGAIYEGPDNHFQDQEDHIVYLSGGARYRIYKVNIASDKEWEESSTGCYVATYAYGSPDAPEVQALRRLRDQVLYRSAAGRLFVRAYYAWLSALAIRVIGALGRPARAAARAALDALARWSDQRLACAAGPPSPSPRRRALQPSPRGLGPGSATARLAAGSLPPTGNAAPIQKTLGGSVRYKSHRSFGAVERLGVPLGGALI